MWVSLLQLFHIWQKIATFLQLIKEIKDGLRSHINTWSGKKLPFKAQTRKVEESWPTLFLDFMYRWGFLTFQLAQGPIYWNLTKNKLSGPPFRRQNRLFSQLLTSSFWSYLGLICNQISQLWVSHLNFIWRSSGIPLNFTWPADHHLTFPWP